ncbi:hypothetical protein [Phenylobacterium sp.]|uniref:hypothetical protein n=1 Tax=Phenylobacterium sp. TaxID=1871053 RepID=UPI0030025875
MNLKMILSAASAAALLTAGAAQAQTAYGTAQGEMNTQAGPSDHKDSSTGLPSVDSTRPTGAEAGKTMSGDMSAGAEMNSSMSGAVNQPGAMARGDASAATEAGTMASARTGASANVTMVTNGPVPDTEENRAKYGGPQSRAGKMTEPTGN